MFALLFCVVGALRVQESRTNSLSLLKDGTRVPSFDSVITMLQNLVSQIETEEQTDEGDYKAFMQWYTAQHDATSSSIGMLSSRLQELAAVIADLEARQHNLATEVARLSGEIDMTQGQIEEAKDKRTQEHESYVQEQLDFDNSVAACEKAIEMLVKFYGDGSPKEDTRPAWMSLISTVQKLQVLATGKKQQKALDSFLQAASKTSQTPGMRGSTMNTAYETKTGEALSIVDQVRGLSSTFQEDQQSSKDQELELQTAFQALMEQKTQQLNSLIAQRDQQQAVLTQVNQELGENQNAEATAKATLLDETAYLSAIEAQERDTSTMYEQRVKDRAEEKQAVNMAMRVLNQENPTTLLQQKHTIRSKLHSRALTQFNAACPRCHDASIFLRQRASQVHSELLATAAMATGSGQALIPVVQQLQELTRRIDEQQAAEEEHKEWCEHELSETAKTKAHHEMLVDQLKGKIEDTKAEIGEKQQAIKDTAEAIADADKEYNELKDVRAKAKSDFEAEEADYKDAIQALNQAIDILADFYRSEGSFIQGGEFQVPVPGAADRAGAPTMASAGGYVKKGGGHVVKILKDTRLDFQAGMENLQKQEAQQVADFEASTAAYNKARADLVDAGNRYAAELQSAQLSLVQLETDLKDNEDKVMAATTYLAQVGGSCNMLIEKFGERTKLREAEKQAILDAIGVLQTAV
jgi:chromosome segregation ATPase